MELVHVTSHGPRSNRIKMAILLAIAAVIFWWAFSYPLFLQRGNKDLVARVARQHVTRLQLDRATEEQLWLEGNPATASPEARAKARKAALEGLITDILLDREIQSQDTPPAVGENEIAARLARLEARFATPAEFEKAMKPQGIPNKKALRERIATQLRREKFVEARIASSTKATDEEARKWFDENQAGIAQPIRVRARHIFIATLDHPPEEAKQKLDVALVELTEKKKDFATLAKELSDDPATKENGGDLGWFARQRMPADFATPVFAMEPGKPALLRTKLGWHLVEVTEKKTGEARAFDQTKPEIIAALEAMKSDKAVKELRESLRKAAGAEVEVFNKAP